LIYDFPKNKDPIRQGDIFVGLPRFEFSLKSIPILAKDHLEKTSWEEIAKEGKAVTAIIAAVPVSAIVISQDCDALRVPDISLCEIRGFRDVERKSKDTKSPKSWVRIITQHARLNQKWFYLPPDEQLGFVDKMAVDFLVTLRVSREDLEAIRHRRKGRLNDLATEHFRERISEFYRRYPYDEWYPLNSEEMEAYSNEYPDIEYFPWQKP